jgi:putative membrane protein insertion efficiency factor
MKIDQILKKIFMLPIWVYKYFISPILPSRCRFLPTCSDYAIDALKTHSIMHALKLIIFRLARCNPFGGSGIDNIPK